MGVPGAGLALPARHPHRNREAREEAVIPVSERKRLIDALERERELIESLELDGDTLAKLKAARGRRNRLIREAMALRIPEQEICSHAGVTRGWLWRLKTEPTRSDDGSKS